MAETGASGELRPLLDLLRDADAAVEVMLEGGSMTPALPDGSTVRIRCRRGGALRAGTIVAYLAGGALTLHRVVGVFPRTSAVLTRGDRNLLCDPPLPLVDVVGYVEACRASDGPWQPAPEAVAPGKLRGAVVAANTALMRAALRVDIRLARAVALWCLVPALPRAWRTYGRGALRAPVVRRLRSGIG